MASFARILVAIVLVATGVTLVLFQPELGTSGQDVTRPLSSQDDEREANLASSRSDSRAVDGKVQGKTKGPAAPTRVRIASLGVDARVVPVAQSEDGVLTPPEDANRVGWWRQGAKLGAKKGAVVVIGHTVDSMAGAFGALGELTRGARVKVYVGARATGFRVRKVTELSKAELELESDKLFAKTGQPRLVLVTCTDWDDASESYLSNTVVVARPLKRKG